MFIRRTSREALTVLSANQRQRNLRDLTVIRRIILLITILVILRFPTIIFMIYAVVVGHLYPLSFSIVGLVTSLCMIFIGLMMIHITPQLRNNVLISKIYRDNRVGVQRTNQHRLTIPSTTANGGTPGQQQKSRHVKNIITS